MLQQGKDTSSVQDNRTQFDVYVLNSVVQIIDKGMWRNNDGYLDVIPNFKTGLSQISLHGGMDVPVIGTVAVNETNPFQLLVTWDGDTIQLTQ